MGRAYPDVAMVGHNLLIAQSGSFMTVGMSIFTMPYLSINVFGRWNFS